MTNRPTDEEIRAYRDSIPKEGVFDEWREWIDKWLSERQAARNGVTDEMVNHAIMISEGVRSIPKGGWGDKTRERMRAALQSIAQPTTSVSDALNFLEEWALSGNQLHGDDIQRLHATVERIAPIAQPVKVPDDYIELNMSNYSDDDVSQLNDWAIRAYEALSTSPHPQQAVPDVCKLVPIELSTAMHEAVRKKNMECHALRRPDVQRQEG